VDSTISHHRVVKNDAFLTNILLFYFWSDLFEIKHSNRNATLSLMQEFLRQDKGVFLIDFFNFKTNWTKNKEMRAIS
jgi:hypothetical protein